MPIAVPFIMLSHLYLRPLKGLLLIAWLASGVLRAEPGPSAPEEGKQALRIICVSSLKEDQEVVLASRDEQGEWSEHGSLVLRSSLISGWLPARPGKLHLARRDAGGLQAVCTFAFPPDARRALVVLIPDAAKKTYRADVVDPAKLKFVKGSTLLVNYSALDGAVVLGALRARIKPGGRAILKPEPDPNGMYRIMAAYAADNKELVPCYDRYVSNNPESRDVLFLLPDATLGLRVFSLSEFGPFD